jgi:hypothetical protein
MKSSCHSLIPLLPLFCNCQLQRLDSIQFLCSRAHIPAGWRLEIRLFTSDYCSILLCAAERFFITTLHGHTENTASIVKEALLPIRCLTKDVILLRALATAAMCLPSRCLAMDLYVTIWSYCIDTIGNIIKYLRLRNKNETKFREYFNLIVLG